MKKDPLRDKSYSFALRIVGLAKYLAEQKQEFVLSRKTLDSGTEIGALIEEARQGEDRTDFLRKMSVANKEAFKTHFRLRLIRDSGFISEKMAESMLADCDELKKMLIATIKTVRETSNQ